MAREPYFDNFKHFIKIDKYIKSKRILYTIQLYKNLEIPIRVKSWISRIVCFFGRKKK